MAGGHGEGINYKGLTMHKPKRWHVVTGKGLCAVMWFWVLYRAKQDGPVVLDYAVFFRAGDIRGKAMVTMATRVDTRHGHLFVYHAVSVHPSMSSVPGKVSFAFPTVLYVANHGKTPALCSNPSQYQNFELFSNVSNEDMGYPFIACSQISNFLSSCIVEYLYSRSSIEFMNFDHVGKVPA
ncbi:hypothetical protein D5086_011692 [Populus alba]|uniref:Uncharacterized protein n=1 Tax=Populus alba TaxID=43335 RepID=A0ACC4CFG7_POPAL